MQYSTNFGWIFYRKSFWEQWKISRIIPKPTSKTCTFFLVFFFLSEWPFVGSVHRFFLSDARNSKSVIKVVWMTSYMTYDIKNTMALSWFLDMYQYSWKDLGVPYKFHMVDLHAFQYHYIKVTWHYHGIPSVYRGNTSVIF